MSAALKNMLDAIYIGLAFGAFMALLLEIVGRWEVLVKSFKKSHPRIYFRGVLRLYHRRHAKPAKI
jgi:hypothetical protein